MGNKIAIILALVLGGMAVYLVRSHLNTTKESFVGEQIQIVVARDKIAKGIAIGDKHLAAKWVPAKFVQTSGMITKWEKHNTLLGGKTRYEVSPGEFINEKIIDFGKFDTEGGILVKTGLRAYTMSASGEGAVAGLLVIGDRIDIMGTFLILGAEAGIGGERTQKARTMFLMQDVEIKALDQVTTGKTSGSFGMLTFELAPIECLVLEFASNTGKVKLVKRNSDDRFVQYDPEQRIEVHRENLLDFIKIASQHRANVGKAEVGLGNR